MRDLRRFGGRLLPEFGLPTSEERMLLGFFDPEVGSFSIRLASLSKEKAASAHLLGSNSGVAAKLRAKRLEKERLPLSETWKADEAAGLAR